MWLKVIQIDTNGANAKAFKNNLKLFDLLVPNIICIIDTLNEVFLSESVDWSKTRPFFSEANNGHCIYLKSGQYIPAYEFTSIIIRLDKLGIDSADIVSRLSDLCNVLAEKNSITSWVAER